MSDSYRSRQRDRVIREFVLRDAPTCTVEMPRGARLLSVIATGVSGEGDTLYDSAQLYPRLFALVDPTAELVNRRLLILRFNETVPSEFYHDELDSFPFVGSFQLREAPYFFVFDAGEMML